MTARPGVDRSERGESGAVGYTSPPRLSPRSASSPTPSRPDTGSGPAANERYSSSSTGRNDRGRHAASLLHRVRSRARHPHRLRRRFVCRPRRDILNTPRPERERLPLTCYAQSLALGLFGGLLIAKGWFA